MRDLRAAWRKDEPVERRRGGTSLPQLMTLAEVARALQLSEKTIRRMVAGRRLPCVRFGRSVRFDPSDVRRWVEARKE